MAYVVLGLVAVVLVVMVVVVSLRDSGPGPWSRDLVTFRAEASGRGLTLVEQRRLQRAVRRGRAVPPDRADLAVLCAEGRLAELEHAQEPGALRFHSWVSGVAATVVVVYVVLLGLGHLGWASVPNAVAWAAAAMIRPVLPMLLRREARRVERSRRLNLALLRPRDPRDD